LISNIGGGLAVALTYCADYLLYEWLVHDDTWRAIAFWITLPILFVLFGLLSLLLQRVMIILGTAFTGAVLVVQGLHFLAITLPFGDSLPTWWHYLLFLRVGLMILLGGCGALLQARASTSHSNPRDACDTRSC